MVQTIQRVNFITQRTCTATKPNQRNIDRLSSSLNSSNYFVLLTISNVHLYNMYVNMLTVGLIYSL